MFILGKKNYERRNDLKFDKCEFDRGYHAMRSRKKHVLLEMLESF